jgi:predicted Zn-dependent protease
MLECTTGKTAMPFLALRRAPLVLLLLVSACALAPPGPAPVSDNATVLALAEQAGRDSAEGRLASAAATLERALRIEPRNPRLWQELARLRLAQNDPEQAEQLAARSNSWAGDDRRLRAANWQLIAEARAARGDVAGAREAQERARRYER